MIEDLLPISALQHIVFCPRQCALIHVERLWVENHLTAEGRVLHARQDDPGYEIRHGIKLIRALRVYSTHFGIWGICDLVEKEETPQGVRITPVETKHGKPKSDLSDKVQLCAQALCLEEIYQTSIPEAYLFYATTRRRLPVLLDTSLREKTLSCISEFRQMVQTGETPLPEPAPKCKRCSFYELCCPNGVTGKSASKYLQGIYHST
ncbi:MAG: CRISPR-associated protein Cas4 [Opitutales bacterium]|nr:CRISPR-associated protein Cas4 [Opitutales bacterium]